ncbi:hypothetical protein [Verrucomicrobium sp. BvORR106]|uniref:hypothetical protein n=1 Tax=Verrucomicrobium sp. BvORR106 TaxID=1403819 RepID=UPI00056F6B40|nr:hypothetical protein [Verrucomicrobium sp. BvORR106]
MVLPIIIAIIALFVSFGVWLNFSAQRSQRRQVQTLAELPCPACNTPCGTEAAEQARQAHLERCREARRQRPDVLVNFVRYWVIACPHCGNEARFHFQTLRLSHSNHDAPVAIEKSKRPDR